MDLGGGVPIMLAISFCSWVKGMIVHGNELGDKIKGDGNSVLLVKVMRR